MDANKSGDRRRPRLLEREDDGPPMTPASKKVKRESETALSPIQRKLSGDSTTVSATEDSETTLSTVQRKLRDEEELTLRMSFWLSQDQDWFSEERVRTQCLGERLQFLLAENASLRERVKYLENGKISKEDEALSDSILAERASCHVLEPSCMGFQA